MIKSTSVITGPLTTLVVTCCLAVFHLQPAAAQTAGNLKCNGCVGSKDIKNKSVKTKDLGNNAVSGAKVKDNSLTAADLGDEAGVDFVGGGTVTESFDLTNSDQTIKTIDITAPAGGYVVVNASGYFFRVSDNGYGKCVITTLTDLSEQGSQFLGNVSSMNPRETFGATRGFAVPAGTTTFRLVCRSDVDVRLIRPHMTAIWVPTRY